jgi:hypothetical protein
MPRDSKRTHNEVRGLYIRADANNQIVPVRENIDVSVADVQRAFDLWAVGQEIDDRTRGQNLREINRAVHPHTFARYFALGAIYKF